MNHMRHLLRLGLWAASILVVACGGVVERTDGSGGNAHEDAGASHEVCANGVDDNRNGQVDEGCECSEGETQSCYGGKASQAGVGICMTGKQICTAAASGLHWGPCTGWGEPASDSCNGLDDDCNGTVDDGCVCRPGETKACSSACGAGKQTCVANAWGPCSAPTPNVEVCDGLDNDCDGATDENTGGSACVAVGVGECKKGLMLCSKGALSCVAGGAVPEICGDAKDNNCNGEVDEECTQPTCSVFPTGIACAPGLNQVTVGTTGSSGGKFNYRIKQSGEEITDYNCNTTSSMGTIFPIDTLTVTHFPCDGSLPCSVAYDVNCP
jgi:hypothetical protein